MAPKDVTFS